MPTDDAWADEALMRMRAMNVQERPHRWRFDALRNVYVGVVSELGEVTAEAVAANPPPLRTIPAVED